MLDSNHVGVIKYQLSCYSIPPALYCSNSAYARG
jgi:hypothetical protein